MKTGRLIHMGRHALAGLLCTVLVFLSVSYAEGRVCLAGGTAAELESKIAALEKKQKNAEKARKQAAENYEASKQDYDDLKGRKLALDAEIEAIEEEAEALRELMIGYSEQKDIVSRRIGALEKELDEQSAVLKDRLRLSYENRNSDMLSVLFTSNGLYEFLTAFDRLSILVEKDRQIIAQCEETSRLLKEEKERLDGISETVGVKSASLHETLSALIEKQAETETMMAELEKDAAAYEKAMEKADEEAKSFSEQLRKRLAELAEQNSAPPQTSSFVWPLPLKYTRISSPFGERIHPVTGKPQFHEGIDIPAPYKTEVYAISRGTVVETGVSYANGKYVVVDHGGGLSSSYSHLSVIGVKKGTVLNAGDQLGLVGMTGWATGYHLDLSVYLNGQAVDPLHYLPAVSG